MPTTILAGSFAFLGGQEPQVLVESFVGPSAAGPWTNAGDGDNGQIAPLTVGQQFWIRFTILNKSSLGFVESFAIDSTDPLLGPDRCAGPPELARTVSVADPLLPNAVLNPSPPPQYVAGPVDGIAAAKTMCVIGPFVAQPGGDVIDFTIDADGFRIGDPTTKEITDDTILPHTFSGAPHAFTFFFDTPGGTNVVWGTTGLDEIPASEFPASLGLMLPVRVDCSDEFTAGPEGGFSDFATNAPRQGSDPRLFSFRITSFDAGGKVTKTCADLSKASESWGSAPEGDLQIRYST